MRIGVCLPRRAKRLEPGPDCNTTEKYPGRETHCATLPQNTFHPLADALPIGTDEDYSRRGLARLISFTLYFRILCVVLVTYQLRKMRTL